MSEAERQLRLLLTGYVRGGELLDLLDKVIAERMPLATSDDAGVPHDELREIAIDALKDAHDGCMQEGSSRVRVPIERCPDHGEVWQKVSKPLTAAPEQRYTFDPEQVTARPVPGGGLSVGGPLLGNGRDGEWFTPEAAESLQRQMQERMRESFVFDRYRTPPAWHVEHDPGQKAVTTPEQQDATTDVVRRELARFDRAVPKEDAGMRTCASCGHPEKPHAFRHPFVPKAEPTPASLVTETLRFDNVHDVLSFDHDPTQPLPPTPAAMLGEALEHIQKARNLIARVGRVSPVEGAALGRAQLKGMEMQNCIREAQREAEAREPKP